MYPMHGTDCCNHVKLRWCKEPTNRPFSSVHKSSCMRVLSMYVRIYSEMHIIIPVVHNDMHWVKEQSVNMLTKDNLCKMIHSDLLLPHRPGPCASP